jgi:Tol biopolymer transport system component
MSPRRFAAVFAVVMIASRGVAQVTARVSVDSEGREGNGSTDNATISRDGRFVAFVSSASNLVAGDRNGRIDVFVHDRLSGETTRVSVRSDGGESHPTSTSYPYGPSISADGRFVAFRSDASDLVPNDTNGHGDIFVHDRQTHETTRVSVDDAGNETDDESWFPALSDDGRFVAFTSYASNLVIGDTNGFADAFVRDRVARTTTRVSVDSLGNQATGFMYPYWSIAISGDGRFVGFDHDAPNLVPDDTNGCTDVFVHDLETGETSRVDVDSAGRQSETPFFCSGNVSLSRDGRFVAFSSWGDDLVPNDTNGDTDVFVHDRASGETRRVSVSSTGAQAHHGDLYGSGGPYLSTDGRYCAFSSGADNLVVGDTAPTCSIDGDAYNCDDVFRHDLWTGETIRLSVSSVGFAGHGDSFAAGISGDGMAVAFVSSAANLDGRDTNGVSDAFVRDLGPCGAGTVDVGRGPAVTVLRINGSSGLVHVTPQQPFALRLDSPPAGPAAARYVVWVWAAMPAVTRAFVYAGETLGCTVDPTPLDALAVPHAALCLRGAGIPRLACAGTTEVRSAATHTPWTFPHAALGTGRARTFTLQGIVEDRGSASAIGFSVTNAVVLDVH